MLTLKEPVKARASENYLAVIEDADGVVHYWLPDGTYDGHSDPCAKDGGKTFRAIDEPANK